MADGGISITIDVADLKHAEELISRLVNLDENELLTMIGSQGESQTRNRITNEKTAPDGTPWKPNLEGTSILMRSGENLLGTVAYIVGNGSVEWGAFWEYAHVHQYGAVIRPKDADKLVFRLKGKTVFAKQVVIPARPFVGISSENETELEDTVTNFLGSLLQ